jgi:uncharacterized membrane-anchored protein
VRIVAALLLPILVLVGLVVRGEVLVKTGRKWQVRISGYDPRDLVSGQYLRYRINWKFEGGTDTPSPDCADDAPCSYCLNRSADDAAAFPEPTVHRVGRSQTAACDSSFPVEDETKLQRYYIPEDMGRNLESALRNREVRLQLSISRAGKVAITQLLVDGAPWRSVLKP